LGIKVFDNSFNPKTRLLYEKSIEDKAGVPKYHLQIGVNAGFIAIRCGTGFRLYKVRLFWAFSLTNDSKNRVNIISFLIIILD
jgi:hypothetical protein